MSGHLSQVLAAGRLLVVVDGQLEGVVLDVRLLDGGEDKRLVPARRQRVHHRLRPSLVLLSAISASSTITRTNQCPTTSTYMRSMLSTHMCLASSCIQCITSYTIILLMDTISLSLTSVCGTYFWSSDRVLGRSLCERS